MQHNPRHQNSLWTILTSQIFSLSFGSKYFSFNHDFFLWPNFNRNVFKFTNIWNLKNYLLVPSFYKTDSLIFTGICFMGSTWLIFTKSSMCSWEEHISTNYWVDLWVSMCGARCFTGISCPKWKWKSNQKSYFSLVRLFATSWTIESMEFSRPEYWSG